MKNVITIFSAAKTWFMHRSLAMRIIALLVIGGPVWFGVSQLTKKQQQKPQYQTAQVTRGMIVVSISGSGQVTAANNGTITTLASGVVTKILVKNGQQVKAGTKLVELDLDQGAKQKFDQAAASYQSTKNALTSAQTDLYSLNSKMFAANQKFMNGAVANGLGTSDTVFIQQSSDWLASEATYKNQQQVIAQAQASLNSAWLSYQQSSSSIYAPISGTVTGLSLQVGSVLVAQTSSTGTSTSQKIGSITTNAPPTVTINLTEIDAPKVKIDDKATLTLDAFPGKTYTGKVISIDPAGAVSSGVTTYPAVIKLDSVETGMYANMSAQANIITETKDDVLKVPTSAVQTQNGQSTKQATVRIFRNGQPVSIPVEIGLSSTSFTEIASGLTEGDVVVTSINTPATTTRTTGSQTQSPFSAIGGGGGAFRGGGGGVRRVD